MATRQEIQVGHDLVIFTHEATDRLWIACQTAQEVHPRTGEPLLYKNPDVDAPIPIPYPVDKLLQEVDNTLAPIAGLNAMVSSFLAKADGKMVDTGLAEYGLVKSDITTDMANAVVAKDEFVTDQKFEENKESLAALGAEKLITEWEIDKIDIKLVKMADRDRFCNSAHEGLDALSYELRGLSSTTGNISFTPKESIDRWLIARCKAAKISASASGHEDAQDIINIANWVEANKDQDHIDIAVYIDLNLPKLPLVRRHWGL